MRTEDWQTQKTEGLRFWEVRRLCWNSLLIVPAVGGLLFGFQFQESYYPSASSPSPTELTLSLLHAVFAANLCYSCAYIIEFLALGTDFNLFLRLSGRKLFFFIGSLLGMGLAALGGATIHTGI